MLLRNGPEVGERHRVEVDVPATPLWYDADDTQLRQVLWTLASNGLRAMPDGGCLKLSASEETGGGLRAALPLLGSGPVMVLNTDAIWTGAPQWQIEALRRIEVPEELQRKYNLPALGAADGPIKNAIFGDNNARLYDFRPAQRAALASDTIAQAKAIYERDGGARTNLAYGYFRTA